MCCKAEKKVPFLSALTLFISQTLSFCHTSLLHCRLQPVAAAKPVLLSMTVNLSRGTAVFALRSRVVFGFV